MTYQEFLSLRRLLLTVCEPYDANRWFYSRHPLLGKCPRYASSDTVMELMDREFTLNADDKLVPCR